MSAEVGTALPVGGHPSNLPGSGFVAVVGMVGVGLAVDDMAVVVAHPTVYTLFPRPVRCSRSLHCLP